MNKKLDDDNYVMFAMKNYDNPAGATIEEFYEDLNTLKYVKRLMVKYEKTGILRERLLLNHIIVLGNLFTPPVASRLLFFYISQNHHSYLKAFLVFLKYLPEEIPEININYVNIDSVIYAKLKEQS
tara:strand:+ start:241 stop:618 length:378 start_codon:yes stop_codon:yes gene_type:complete